MSLGVQGAKRKCGNSKGTKNAKTSASTLKSKGEKEERGKGVQRMEREIETVGWHQSLSFRYSV